LKPESGVQKDKTVSASEVSKPKGVKPKVVIDQKQPKSHPKVQGVTSKTSSTNLKGPIKQWVPKYEIVNTADMHKSKAKAKIMVSGQRLLKTHDRREVNVPLPNNERRRKCEVWRQKVWQDHWYRNYW